jgi:hypothetical protein
MYRQKCLKSKSKRWEPGAALTDYEHRVNWNIKFGGQTGHQGLGFGTPSLKNASVKEKREAIIELSKKDQTEQRLVSLRDLPISGNFLKWDKLMATQTDWNTQILGMSSSELSFTLNNQAQSSPCPSNLRRCGYNIIANCSLCGKPAATAKHLLSGCPVALNQHRYTWRHDNVLRSIQSDLCGLISKANRSETLLESIKPLSESFVKAGVCPGRKQKSQKKSLLPEQMIGKWL